MGVRKMPKATTSRLREERQLNSELKSNLNDPISEFAPDESAYSENVRVEIDMLESAITLGGAKSQPILSNELIEAISGVRTFHELLWHLKNNSNLASQSDAENIAEFLDYVYENTARHLKLDDVMESLRDGFEELFENEVALRSLVGNQNSKAR